MPIITTEVLPDAPGFWNQWVLIGAPTRWEAMRSELDASYVQGRNTGQFVSAHVTVPPVPPGHRLLSRTLYAWLQWAGNAGAVPSALVTPQIRKNNVNLSISGGAWVVPVFDTGDPMLAGPIVRYERALSAAAFEDLHTATVELVVLNGNSQDVNCHALKMVIVTQPFSDSAANVGKRQWWRRA